jgi:hypothetical protein
MTTNDNGNCDAKKMTNIRAPMVVPTFALMGLVMILLILLGHVLMTFTDFRTFVFAANSLLTATLKDPRTPPNSSRSDEPFYTHANNLIPSTLHYPTSTNQATHTAGDNTIIHKAFLQYTNHLQANEKHVEFHGNLSVTATGKVCFTFALVINATAPTCPFPSIRLRLSGAALVNVRLQRHILDDDDVRNTTQLDGCSLLPVPGTYYVDANLVHCLMDVNCGGGPRMLKLISGKPVQPDLDVNYTPYKFDMPPFLRMNAILYSRNQSTAINAFSNHAWVFAPPCPNSSIYTISERCSKLKSTPFVPTTFQLEGWRQRHNYSSFLAPEFHTRFDDFMWLPVDSRNGLIDFPAEQLSHEYTPIPSDLQYAKEHASGQYNQTMLFVGASHMRILRSQVSQIYYNLTFGHDGCLEEHEPPLDLGNNQTRFGYMELRFGTSGVKDMLQNDAENYYDKYILTLGHWDAGFPGRFPTKPGDFLQSLLLTIQTLEDFAKPGAQIFVLSVNQHPMGYRMLYGDDWRVPPLIDAYNDIIWSQVTVDDPVTSPKSFRFRNFNRTYFLDNTDIMDPIWDSASDFHHPCRYGMRPMALRILDFLKI